MKREDIIRMAREAGATPYTNRHYPDRPTHTFNVEQLERFFQLTTEWERKRMAWTQEHWTEYEHNIAASEREACAKVCEDIEGIAHSDDEAYGSQETSLYYGMALGAESCAAAIRARGETNNG